MLINIIKENIYIIRLFIIFSRLLYLALLAKEFIIIFVSCPVYATNPTIHLVFLRLQPLKIKLLGPIDTI